MFFLANIAGMQVQAASFDVFGELKHLYDYKLIDINVTQSSSVNFFTDSFGDGNFDPMMALYTQSGEQVGWNDDYSSTFGGAVTGGYHDGQGVWDSSLKLDNLLGNYILAINVFNTQYWAKIANENPLQKVYTSLLTTPLSRGEDFHINIYGDNVSLGFAESEVAPTNVPSPGGLALISSAILFGWFFQTFILKRKLVVIHHA